MPAISTARSLSFPSNSFCSKRSSCSLLYSMPSAAEASQEALTVNVLQCRIVIGCRIQLCTVAILICEAQGLTCRSVIGKRQSMHALLIAFSVTTLHAHRDG